MAKVTGKVRRRDARRIGRHGDSTLALYGALSHPTFESTVFAERSQSSLHRGRRTRTQIAAGGAILRLGSFRVVPRQAPLPYYDL